MTHTGTGPRKAALTVGPRRAGVAYFIVLFAVFILSIILIGLWNQFFAELKQTSKQQDDTAHFYLAEAIMAKGINCIKKKPWLERFYIDNPPGASPDGFHFALRLTIHIESGTVRVWHAPNST